MYSRRHEKSGSIRALAGLRVGIKDLFHLRGVQTTLSSRDWTLTHPVETETARFVRNMIAQGAVIVGKTATSAFAGPDWPNDGWVDFHCKFSGIMVWRGSTNLEGPFNPRGDGYLNPAGSSVGAATALAGYEWLDISLGTDCEYYAS